MKKKLLLIAIMMIGCISAIKAEQTEQPIAYTVVKDGVATLYYDRDRWNRLGTVYEGFPKGTSVTQLGNWRIVISGGWTEADFTEFVIDSSFAEYRELTSTAYWFTRKSNLTSITGMEYLHTENVTDMTGMFAYCSKLTSIDLSHFCTDNVIYTVQKAGMDGSVVYGLFTGCSSLKSLDLSKFNTKNFTQMRSMFSGCSSLTSLGLSGFNTENVTTMESMFSGCSSLTSLHLSSFDTENVTTMESMFSGCSSLTSLDLSGFDTKHVKFMNGMFSSCSSLTSLDLSGFNTENVWRMYDMFSSCSSLTSLDLSSFNTENVTDMSGMFYGCSSLTSLDLSSFNIMKDVDIETMFSRCTNLQKIITGEFFVTDYVKRSGSMFAGCKNLVGQYGTKYDKAYEDKTKAYVGEGGYFWGVPTTSVRAYAVFNNGTVTFYYDSEKGNRPGNLDELGTSDDTSWADNSHIKKIVFDDSFRNYHSKNSIKGIVDGFNNKSELTEIAGLKNLDTSKLTSMSYMFRDCSSLISLDLSGFNTENVTDMSYMFKRCSSLTSLDLSSFNTENVTDMSYMFDDCSNLTSLDLSGFNTENVTDMNNMFSGCSSLTSLDMSGFNTKNVTDMRAMFNGCSVLPSLDLSSFNTENVAGMSSMFAGCSGLTSLDLSKFNTENVTNMSGLFGGCSGLSSLDLSSFNTKNVTDMSGLFNGCSGLTSIDLSCINTENVEDMSRMFRNCSGFTSLDLSSFNTDKVEYVSYMFYNCSNLTTIYVSDIWNKNGFCKDNQYTFQSCYKLVGGDGTTYDDRYAAGYKAYVGEGGYLTLKTMEIAPISEKTEITFASSDFIKGNNSQKSLRNTIINNAYFCIDNTTDASNPDGFFDATDESIVINKATTGEEMQTALTAAMGSTAIKENFTGMVIEVNGRGKLTVNAKTNGKRKLAIKIGNNAAKTFAKVDKGDVGVNYNVKKNTYVYIYAVDEDNSQQSLQFADDITATASENSVKVYSITVTPEITGVENVIQNENEKAVLRSFTIDGKALTQPQKGMNILKISDGTVRKIVVQ